jgi:hypothetical protein
LKLKDEIVFDIVKSILDNSYTSPALEVPIESVVPQTPRSPIRPADDRPLGRRRPAATNGKVKVSLPQEDKENSGENELASAVVALKFDAPAGPSARPRRQNKSKYASTADPVV